MVGSRYFEIPVLDMDRAVAFYEKVFGVLLDRQVVDGVELALFPDDDGSSGALAFGESYVPSRDGTRVYFSVPSLGRVLRRAMSHGASELYPITSIGDLGWVAEFLDTEGNRIALIAPAPD